MLVPEKNPHLMISYQWDSQSTMLQIRDKLRSAGFTVWIDVQNMSGSTLESMAAAVENCSVFLMAISRKYLESPNCRSGRIQLFNCLLIITNFTESKWNFTGKKVEKAHRAFLVFLGWY